MTDQHSAARSPGRPVAGIGCIGQRQVISSLPSPAFRAAVRLESERKRSAAQMTKGKLTFGISFVAWTSQ